MAATRRHPDATPPYRQAKDKTCRWCWCDLSPPRRTFCSKECVHEYREETDWNYMVHKVRKRDGYRCAMCGFDGALLARLQRWALEQHLRLGIGMVGGWDKAMKREIFGTRREGVYSTEVDHIIPRHLGGTNAIDNLRVLCVECHLAVTNQQVKAIAAAKRASQDAQSGNSTVLPASG